MNSNKKELVDYLWDWADKNGDWAKLLINYVVEERELSEEQRQLILKYFLRDAGIKHDLESISFSKPTYMANEQTIKLNKISEINGVNKLAENQELCFGKNFTVVYGQNGAGKSGYGRILKSIGACYGSKVNILSDIDLPQINSSANIEYEINSEPKITQWNCRVDNGDLAAITFFDNSGVNVSLSDKRDLLVTPMGFHLFELAIKEIKVLSAMFDKMLSRLEYELKWKNDFDKESEEYNFLNSLNYNTNKEEVAKYTSFTDADKKILDDNRNELKELNLSLIKRKLTDEKRKNCEIESVINDIKLAQELISESNIKEFIKSEKDLLKDIEEKNSGLEQTASEYGVELFNTKEYKQFIIAAEEYIRNLSSEYPEENSKCIFCQQELSEESINLISSYRKVLCKGNESKKLEIKGKIDTFKEKVNNLNGKIMFRNNVFGKLSDMEVIQPEFITDYNFKIMDFKSLIEADNIEINFEYDFENALEELGNKQAEINDVKSEYENTIQGLEDQETKIIQRIRTLEYREKLSSLKEEIEKYIKDRKLYKKLSSYKRLLNTNSLSRKTSEARSDLIQKNFKELFERELEQLGKSKLNISLEFGTVRGKSKLIQDMNKYSVSEVLSEGEQKAIALSEFLAELKLEKSVAPVVFDDPVNSLDHLLIEKFAKRMLKLSKERQVIVFTHSILLFNSLVYQIMNTYKYLDSQKYNVSRQYGVPGYLSSFEEPINSPKKYIKEINVMLNNPDKSRPEDSVAAEGYGLLRSAIEVFVEYEMLQSVVKRYQKNVALSLLTKIDGASIDSNKQELNDVFTRCCGFISGHSNPEIVVQSATLDELKTDFDKFKDIRGKFV